MVKTGTKVKIIPVQDVQYLQADDDYVSVFTQEGSYLKNKTMNFFEQMLDPRYFVRVHRSYIIAIQQITRIDPYEKDSHLAILKSGAKIPVSKSGYVKLKGVLGI
ncbi:MAG: LytR/AlgR family response regulator transcription factor [Sphingobacteriales bacterium]